MSGSVTAQEALGHLVDVDYPADKDALVASAEAHGAPEVVVRALRAIPPSVDYRNDDEVVRSLRLDPTPGRDAGAAAEQARYDSKPGTAETSRDPRQDRVMGEDRRTVRPERSGDTPGTRRHRSERRQVARRPGTARRQSYRPNTTS